MIVHHYLRSSLNCIRLHPCCYCCCGQGCGRQCGGWWCPAEMWTVPDDVIDVERIIGSINTRHRKRCCYCYQSLSNMAHTGGVHATPNCPPLSVSVVVHNQSNLISRTRYCIRCSLKHAYSVARMKMLRCIKSKCLHLRVYSKHWCIHEL